MAVMMAPRETWTDERLDDLSKKVDEGFKEVNTRLDRFESRIDNDIGELRRMMVQGFFAMTTIMCTGFAALVAAAVF